MFCSGPPKLGLSTNAIWNNQAAVMETASLVAFQATHIENVDPCQCSLTSHLKSVVLIARVSFVASCLLARKIHPEQKNTTINTHFYHLLS